MLTSFRSQKWSNIVVKKSEQIKHSEMADIVAYRGGLWVALDITTYTDWIAHFTFKIAS